MKQVISILVFLLLVWAGGKTFSQGCAPESTGDGVNVFGFVQSQYVWKYENTTNGSFGFERVRLGVNGNIPYDFSYYAVVELSPMMSAAGNPYLLDAFVTYSRFNWARISLGSFKTPFGLEVNTPCSGLITAYRATATLQMVAPFRDMGLVLMGGNESSFLNYQLGMMNGSGLGRTDNNLKKDLVGRVVLKPLSFLKVGGSFRYGFPSYNNNEASRTTFGAEVQANISNFTLMGEYIADQGDYNRDLGGGCAGNLIELGEERSGGYLTLGYMTPWKIQPVFRFDFFDSGNLQDYKENNLTVGVNYFFNDWTRMQANYVYKAETPSEIKNDVFMIQVQVVF
jgi:phosphate-selective porin OprO and OprP